MARKLRMEYGGACYHVINRGNYRRDLFNGAGAAESFERCLLEAAAKYGWRLHAFVIMRNHFHLAVETPEPNLSEGMRWLQSTWAMRFNRFRKEHGRPFQGRYKALHVEPGHALAQVAHYIHLNPVRAKLVTVERLAEFRWSSLRLFISGNRPDSLEAETILRESGGLPDSRTGWRRYLDYLGVLSEEDAKSRSAHFTRLSRGWVIGSPEFKARLKKDLVDHGAGAARFSLLGADSEAQREARADLWEEQLQAAAKALRVNLDKLPAKKSDAGKVTLAAVMKAGTSVNNGWLAERLQMGPAASVSQFVRRWRLERGEKDAAFHRALSKIKP